MKSTKLKDQSFIIPVLCFISTLLLFAFINEVRFSTISELSRCSLRTTPLTSTANSTSSDDIRVLVAVLTMPEKYDQRHFLRLIYGTQAHIGARVDVKFVFCNLTSEDQKVLIALEIMCYNDIIILDCEENMDKGKSYTFFSNLPEMFSTTEPENTSHPPYHYVMKTDDDTYLRLDNLVESLKPLAREDLYYGFVVPCRTMDPFAAHYMAGWGYLVSWDIVQWIRESDIPKNHHEGFEDLVFGEWIRDGHLGKNRYNGKWSMYDFPRPSTACSHEFWPNTIAVHKLKDQAKWIETLNYFNVTRNLKPSKLYHID